MLGRLFRQGSLHNSTPINNNPSINVHNTASSASPQPSPSCSYDDGYTRSILYGTQNVNQLRNYSFNSKLFRIVVSQDGGNLRTKQVLFDSSSNENLPKPSKKLFNKLHHNVVDLNDFMFGCSLPSNELCPVTKIHILPPLNSLYGQYHSVLISRLFSITNDEIPQLQNQNCNDWNVSSTLPMNSNRNQPIMVTNEKVTHKINSRFAIGIIIPIELIDDLSDIIIMNWIEISYYLASLQKLIYKKLILHLNSVPDSLASFPKNESSSSNNGPTYQSPFISNKRIQFPNYILQQEADINQQILKLIKLVHFVTLPKLIDSNSLMRLALSDEPGTRNLAINSLLINWVMEILNWLTFKDGNDGFLPSLLALILPIRTSLTSRPFQRVRSKHRELTRIVILTGNPMVVKKLIFILNGFIPNENLLDSIQISNMAQSSYSATSVNDDETIDISDNIHHALYSEDTSQQKRSIDSIAETFSNSFGISNKHTDHSTLSYNKNSMDSREPKTGVSSNLTSMKFNDVTIPHRTTESSTYYLSSNPIKFLKNNQASQVELLRNSEADYTEAKPTLSTSMLKSNPYTSPIKSSSPINIRSTNRAMEDTKKSSVTSGISPSNLGVTTCSDNLKNSSEHRADSLVSSKPIFIKNDAVIGSPIESDNSFNRSTPSIKGWEIPSKSIPSTMTTAPFSSIETSLATPGIPITSSDMKLFPNNLSKLSSMAYLSTSLNSSLSSSASKYSLSNIGGSFLEKWKNSLGSNQNTPSHIYDEYIPPPHVGKRNSFQSFRSPSPAMENDEFNWQSGNISLSSSVGPGSPITPNKLSRTHSMHDLYNLTGNEEMDELSKLNSGMNLDIKRTKSGVYNPLFNDSDIKNVADHNRDLITRKCHEIMKAKLFTKQDGNDILEVKRTNHEDYNSSNLAGKHTDDVSEDHTVTCLSKQSGEKGTETILKLQGLNSSIAFSEEFRPEFNLQSCPPSTKLEQQIMTTMKQDLLFYQNNYQYQKITTRTILVSLRSREIKTIEMKINNDGVYQEQSKDELTMNKMEEQTRPISPGVQRIPVSNTYRTKIKKVYTPTKNSGNSTLINSVDKILGDINELVNSCKSKDPDFQNSLTKLVSQLLIFDEKTN